VSPSTLSSNSSTRSRVRVLSFGRLPIMKDTRWASSSDRDKLRCAASLSSFNKFSSDFIWTLVTPCSAKLPPDNGPPIYNASLRSHVTYLVERRLCHHLRCIKCTFLFTISTSGRPRSKSHSLAPRPTWRIRPCDDGSGRRLRSRVSFEGRASNIRSWPQSGGAL